MEICDTLKFTRCTGCEMKSVAVSDWDLQGPMTVQAPSIAGIDD
jgi:hypothetical protein